MSEELETPVRKGNLWVEMDCSLDDGRSSGIRIGLVALAGDSVIEAELRRFLPADVELYSTRIRIPANPADASVQAVGMELANAVQLLLPGQRLDVVAFGCTSVTAVLGADPLRAVVKRARPLAAFADPVTAAIDAFAALELKRVALLTPYSNEANERMRSYICDRGIDVSVCGTFRAPATSRLGRAPAPAVEPHSIAKAVSTLGGSDVDGVFVSCTGLRCSAVIQAVEDRLGKPVVTSNQALAWQCMRLAGCRQPVIGFGRLLASA